MPARARGKMPNLKFADITSILNIMQETEGPKRYPGINSPNIGLHNVLLSLKA